MSKPQQPVLITTMEDGEVSRGSQLTARFAAAQLAEINTELGNIAGTNEKGVCPQAKGQDNLSLSLN